MYIRAIDVVRFFAALWVALSHGAIPLDRLSTTPQAHNLVRALQGAFSGISAVMIFFIVSGLCIHLPYVSAARLRVTAFLIRRVLRIGAPLAIILLLLHFADVGTRQAEELVLWSVYIEMIYYIIYPVVFILIKRFELRILLSISVIISITITIYWHDILYIQELGYAAWLWGLPIWLSGCFMAELLKSGVSIALPLSVWMWRAVGIAFGTAATYGEFHLRPKIGYPISMLPMAAYSFFWLWKELHTKENSWPRFEKWGRASYSLYLIHPVVIYSITIYSDHNHVPFFIELLLSIISLFVVTFLFYQLIERPSHRLARALSSYRGEVVEREVVSNKWI